MAEHAKVISPDRVEFPQFLAYRIQWRNFDVKRAATVLVVARVEYCGRITQSVTAHCPPMIQARRSELHDPAIEGWQNEIPIAI